MHTTMKPTLDSFDIYLCAFLLAQGAQLEGVEREGGVCHLRKTAAVPSRVRSEVHYVHIEHMGNIAAGRQKARPAHGVLRRTGFKADGSYRTLQLLPLLAIIPEAKTNRSHMVDDTGFEPVTLRM